MVVDDVDSRATFHYVVRAQNLIHLLADRRFDKRERATRALGVASQALPVALEGEGNSLENAQRGEQAPAGHQSRLSGRQPHFVDGQQLAVVKYVVVDHSRSSDVAHSILAQTSVCTIQRE